MSSKTPHPLGLLDCLNDWDRVAALLDEPERAWLAAEISSYRCILRARQGGTASELADRVWIEVDDDPETQEPLKIGTPLDQNASIVRHDLMIIEHGGDGERLEFEATDRDYVDPERIRRRLRQRTLHRKPPTYRRRVEADARALARTMRRRRASARAPNVWWIHPSVRPNDRIDDIPAPSDRVAEVALYCARDWERIGPKLRLCESPRCIGADGAPCWFDGTVNTSARECPPCRNARSRWTRNRDRILKAAPADDTPRTIILRQSVPSHRVSTEITVSVSFDGAAPPEARADSTHAADPLARTQAAAPVEHSPYDDQ